MKRVQTYLGGRCCLVLGLALLMLLMAGCSFGGSGTGNGPGTTPTTGGSGPTIPTGTPSTTVQQCGIVHSQRLTVVPGDAGTAKSVEDCFWQAYQQCRSAAMIYSQGNLDTAKIHNFLLKSEAGVCVIVDALQDVVLPKAPTSVGTYLCTGLTQQSDGLHFTSCGSEGNVLVPSA